MLFPFWLMGLLSGRQTVNTWSNHMGLGDDLPHTHGLPLVIRLVPLP
jgi:hypothetical protein